MPLGEQGRQIGYVVGDGDDDPAWRVAGRRPGAPCLERVRLGADDHDFRRIETLLERDEQRRVRMRKPFQPFPRGVERALRRPRISGVPEQMAEPSEDCRGDSVSDGSESSIIGFGR